MTKSFRLGIVCAAFFVLGVSAFSQVTIDPNADFYASAREWQVRGYIDFLPQISPYPSKVVKEILENVIENGRDADVEKAQYYNEKYFGKKWHVGVEAGANVNLSAGAADFNRNFVYGSPLVFGDWTFGDLVTFGYDLGLNIHNASTQSGEMLPAFVNDSLDTWGDPATFGPLEGNLDMVAGLNIGNSMFNGMLSANRIGYANVFGHDNIILNPKAYHTNNFVFNFADKKWQFTQLISSIAAKNFRNDFKADKFLAFHSLRFTPIKQLAISYYEAAIFGERFDPSYLIPAPFMLLQGMFDAGDNNIYGLQFEYRAFDGFEAFLSLAVDDLSVNDWAQGNFDSKFKAALQTGVVYAPKAAFCTTVAFDYTFVLPYMYSHWVNSANNHDPLTADEFNYQNYTNHGVSIGSSLPPNSDRLHFEIGFAPVKRLALNVTTDFVRHANQSESWSDEEARTHTNKFGFGTVGAETDPYPTSVQERNTFLSQEHIMYVVQLGLDTSYEIFRNRAGFVTVKFGYTFEFIYNKGVDSPIYTSKVSTAEEIALAKSVWAGKLHNEFNNYFRLSVMYAY